MGFFVLLCVFGLCFNLFVVLIVIIGGLVIVILYKLFDILLLVVLGIFFGVVINTLVLGVG